MEGGSEKRGIDRRNDQIKLLESAIDVWGRQETIKKVRQAIRKEPYFQKNISTIWNDKKEMKKNCKVEGGSTL